MEIIPFNLPYLTGKEIEYINETLSERKFSGNGRFTKLCQSYFEETYGFKKCLLTSSCTDALEMCAILLDIQPGDEVIMPSYTFVSTANAFVLRGAKIVFADSSPDNPNIDSNEIEKLITKKTKAIVAVHYAGVSCDMEKIMALADAYKLFVVEDAAQSIDSYYITNTGEKKSLGSIGHLSAFSFHETKNIQCGEGGMLVVNDGKFLQRAEIVWEKGTNRCAFYRGEVDKYNWVDVGSSFLMSELTAAFLYGQIQYITDIQNQRKEIWNSYYTALLPLMLEKKCDIQKIPPYASGNAHLFYLVCKTPEERTSLINKLRQSEIHAIFHYLSLHNSPYFKNKHGQHALPNADRYSDCLVRLPMFYELSQEQLSHIIGKVKEFYQ